jgi:predicted DNA-binding protein
MSAISIRLPDSLHKRIKQLAKRDNVSINQMVTLAVAEKLSALETEDYLATRASRASKSGFKRALTKVPDRQPDTNDRI